MFKIRLIITLTVVPILFLLYSCSSDSNGADNKTRVFVSTDIAAGLVGGWRAGPADNDDAYAVQLISTYVDAIVEGAAVLRGNDLRPAELFAADQIFIQTPGVWNGPIFAGAFEALPTPDSVQWTGSPGPPETLSDICINEGVIELANLLSESKEPITILAIGPLTDIACLVINFPDVLGNIKDMVFLAGRAPGQVLKYPFSDVIFTDFNVAQDLRAAHIVLENSDIPVTFITFSVSSSTTYTRAQIDSLLEPGCSDRAKILSRAAQQGMNFFQENLNLNGLDTFDINAAYYIAKPELFICEEAGFEFVQCKIGTPGVYNGADNPCAGHGPNQPAGLNSESEQLWVGPTLLGQSRPVISCNSYINQEELERFEDGTIEVFCKGEVWSNL
jgi:pyrimidine-specific ribonucleoside hydrolase